MFATKPGKNDPNLLFGRMFLAGPAADLPHMLVGRLRPGFLSHLRPLQSGYDEPEILRYSNPTICLMIADGEQPLRPRAQFDAFFRALIFFPGGRRSASAV